MAGRSRQSPFACRDISYRFIIAVIIAVSVSTNLLFLLNQKTPLAIRDDVICAAILNNAGGQKLMEYIESNRDIEIDVKSAFVSQITRCLQNGDYSYASARNIDAILRQLNSLKENSHISRHTSASSSSSDNSQSNHHYIHHNKSSTNRNREDIELFLAQPIINPHNYPYIFDQSNACSDERVKFIVAVPSSPGNFENRIKVRENRAGKYTRDPQNRAKLLFFLGSLPSYSDSDGSIQAKIEAEQKEFGDLVQARFVDTYRNLTKKASLILRWSTSFCDKSKFVLRMDDDLRVDLSKMAAAMERTLQSNEIGPYFILGNLVTDWGPVRNRKSKYFTSLDEYPFKKLPDFILGGSMGYSVATAHLLYHAYQRLSPFWLDDVFVTAMCASRVGVAIQNSSAFHFEHWKW